MIYFVQYCKIWNIILPVVEDRLIPSLSPLQFSYSPPPHYYLNKRNIKGRVQYQAALCSVEVQGSRNVSIPRMDLDTEEIRETHNFYIESTHGSFKNIS